MVFFRIFEIFLPQSPHSPPHCNFIDSPPTPAIMITIGFDNSSIFSEILDVLRLFKESGISSKSRTVSPNCQRRKKCDDLCQTLGLLTITLNKNYEFSNSRSNPNP